MRNARVRIIELRNDLKANTDDLAKALELVYAPSAQPEANLSPQVPPENVAIEEAPLKPFAKVDGVAPGSPAAEAASVMILPLCRK